MAQKRPKCNPSIQEGMGSKPKGIIRWIHPSQDTIERVKAARLKQKLKSLQKSSTSSTHPPPTLTTEDKFADLPHFLGILYNFTRKKDQEDQIPKEVYKVKKDEQLPSKLFGLKIPPNYFNASNKAKIVVYFLSESLARTHKIRVTKKNRQRKKRKVDEVEIMDVDDEPQVIDLVSSQSQESSVALMEVDVEPSCPINFEPPLNWNSFDPWVNLSTSTLKYNKNAKIEWKAEHCLVKIASMDKKMKVKEAIELLKKDILNQQIRRYKTESDRDENLNLSSFVDNVPSLNRILGEMVKFHQKYKNIHFFMKYCLRPLILKNAGAVVRKNEKKERRMEKKLKRQQKQEELLRPTTTTGPAEEGNGPARKRKRIENDDVEVIDLTVLSMSPIPHAIASQESQIPVAPTIISQNMTETTVASSNRSSSLFKSSSSGEKRSDVTPLRSRHPAGHHRSQNKSYDKISQNLFQCSYSTLQTSHDLTPSQRLEQNLFICKALKDTVAHKCILSTLTQILKYSGADKLLGSLSNRKGFFRFVRNSIFLGGISSNLRLNALMACLSAEEEKCKWLDDGKINDIRLRQWFLAKIATWLFNEYILVILKTGFYVTELSGSRNELGFYLKNSWISITDKWKYQHLNNGKLTRASQSGQDTQITRKLRFIPKKNNTVRTILSYDKEYLKMYEMKSVKQLLMYLSSQVSPHGVGDALSIQVKWRNFLAEWKQANCPKLYFLRADIADAFPSVNLKKLQEILYTSQSEEQLYLKHYESKNTNKRITRHFHHVAKDTDPRPLFMEHRSWKTYTPRGRDLFDQSEALESIKSILDTNVIRLGKIKYQFNNGLPQGWSNSQYLCNLYYGSMDNEYFKDFLNVKGELFIRNVDDYFYVTSDANRVDELYQLMEKGNSKYGFKLNHVKTRTNIFVSSNSSVDDTSADQVVFFGWKFCLLTGHVMRDYSTYAGLDIVSTLSFKVQENQSCETFIQNRLLNLTPLRMYALLFDPAINCRRRFFMNIMEAGLMAAFRFYGMCRTLYPDLKVLTTDKHKINSLCRALCIFADRVARYLKSFGNQLSRGAVDFHNCPKETPCNTGHAEGRRRQKIFTPKEGASTNQLKGTIKETKKVGMPEIRFIIFHAFIIKLLKHHAVFHKHGQGPEKIGQTGILPLLRYKRKECQDQIPEVMVQEILSAVGTILPPTFAAMKK